MRPPSIDIVSSTRRAVGACYEPQMSKAFTKDDAPDEAAVVAPRAPLPEGVPNYVTPRGLDALHAELVRLHDARAQVDEADRARRAALTAQIEALEARIASAEVVEPGAHDEARFGATVTVRGEHGERRLEIVGVDEADAAHGLVAFTSPIARAILGKRAGDVAVVKTPRGEEELEIVRVAYA